MLWVRTPLCVVSAFAVQQRIFFSNVAGDLRERHIIGAINIPVDTFREIRT